MQLTHIILEIDSTQLVNMNNNPFNFTIHLQPLFCDFMLVIHLLGSTIHVNHIHRESHSCDDVLAIRDHDIDFTLVILILVWGML
jgi:hypothetical protein